MVWKCIDTCRFATLKIGSTFEPRHAISNNVECATSKGSDQSAHTRSLIRAFAGRLNIMSVMLLAEHHLVFLSLKRDCTGWSESALVKMPHCWKPHVVAHFIIILTIFVLEATWNCSVLSFKCFQLIPCEQQLSLSADNFANSLDQIRTNRISALIWIQIF